MLALNRQTPLEQCAALGQRARQWRLAAGLTQRELAARAGLALGTVRTLERRGAAQLVSVARVAAALGHLEAFSDLFAGAVNSRRRAPKQRRVP
jgi:transcriptional regulator with XRE-family HTH domain